MLFLCHDPEVINVNPSWQDFTRDQVLWGIFSSCLTREYFPDGWNIFRDKDVWDTGSSHCRLDFREAGILSSSFLCAHHEKYVFHRCFIIYWTNYKLVRMDKSPNKAKGMPDFTPNLHCSKWKGVCNAHQC